MSIRLAVLLSVLAIARASAELPAAVLPEGVGVNIHFTRGHEKDLDLIAAAGFKLVRMDFSWAATEPQKGKYNFAEYDELTANLVKRGLRPYFILDYSNPVFETAVTNKNPVTGKTEVDTASPRSRKSVIAFARWAAVAAQHFKAQPVIWEIWNEPNIGFWKPEPNVQHYTELVLATCRSMRIVHPTATIVAPATSGFAWTFMEDCFKAGVLEQIDAVSVHPYRDRSQGPETAAADYRRLREMIATYAKSDAKKSLPILSGEWGYSSFPKGVSLETQAAFIARQQLANLLAGVPVSIWYDWKNDGTNADENEENFGTVTHTLEPKPAYQAIKTLTGELAGYRVEKRVGEASEDFVLLLVNTAGARKLAVWTTGKPHSIALPLAPGASGDVKLVSGQGKASTAAVRDGKLELALTDSPAYVTLAAGQLAE